MASVAKNLEIIKASLPQNVKLVAVTKTKPPEVVMEAWKAGHRIFGENRVQELVSKMQDLPTDISWHLIGHLQSNKVKYIASFISMIHSVDSLKLLRVINREAAAVDRKIDCLLQIHIASEESKFGFNITEVEEMLADREFSLLKNVTICGVMGMATFTENSDIVRGEFIQLRKNFEYLREKYFASNERFTEISMGMSDDFKIAIEEGSTILRIGSKIFGER